jgi:uncharacterized integral membrane protein
MEGVENAPVDPVIEVDRWKNRRKMSWLAMIAGLLFPLLFLIKDSVQLGVIALPFYGFVSVIVVAYIGAATVDDKWSRDNVRH